MRWDYVYCFVHSFKQCLPIGNRAWKQTARRITQFKRAFYCLLLYVYVKKMTHYRGISLFVSLSLKIGVLSYRGIFVVITLYFTNIFFNPFKNTKFQDQLNFARNEVVSWSIESRFSY